MVADAVQAHNAAVFALKAASEREAARLAAELASAQQQAREADSTCANLERLCADADHARGHLQQQLEQSWRQLEVRASLIAAMLRMSAVAWH